MRNLIAVVCILPFVALAQSEAEVSPPPVATTAAQPVHAAVPILRDWNVGAGFTFPLGGVGFSGSLGGLAGLAGFAGGASLLSLSIPTAPRMTILIERRLSERLFLGFQAAVSYRANQSDTSTAISSRDLILEGAVGLRRIFNPRGIVEVSWFGNAGVGYGNFENRNLGFTVDPTTAMFVQTPQTVRGNSFAVGAVTGITLERELIAGLALRLSSSILGISYGSIASTILTGDASVATANHGVDAGLRFSPAIELRYAF